MISQSGCKKHVTFGNQQKIWVNGETSLGKLLLFDSFRHKQYGRVSRSSGLAKTVLQGTVCRMVCQVWCGIKVFHLIYIFQCLEKWTELYYYIIHYSCRIIDIKWFQPFILLATYFSGEKKLDVMQDKGHNTANSTTFEILSLGNHAYMYKSHRHF